jgi:Arc/MetJ family transcription regulator
MRTNIDLDDKLVAEAMALSGARTKREVIERALQRFVQIERQAEIRKFRGKLHWQGDLGAMRLDD